METADRKLTLEQVIGRYGFGVALVLILLFGFLYTKSEVTMSGNEATRLGTTQCVVDLGTFALENGMFKTVDRVIMNNHVYSDKPLLLPVLACAPYWVIKNVFGFSFGEHYYLVIFLLNYLCAYLLNVLMFWLFYKMLCRKLPDAAPSFRLFGALALIFSTMLFSYSVAINNHTSAAAVVLILLYCLERHERDMPLGMAFLIGILTGTLLNFEYIFGGIFGLSAFVLVLFSPEWKIRWLPAVLYACGAFIMIGVMFSLNFIAFGTLMPLYSETHHVGLNPRILFYIFNSTFGFKGFFLYMPALLFIIPAVLKTARARGDRLKVTMLISVAAAFLLYWLVTSEYGGWSFGFRYLIPAIPVMFYFIILDLQNWRRSAKTYLFLLCVGWGVIVSQLGAYNPWCISYEPHITGERYAKFKNSFLGNFLCWSFEYYPDSFFTRFQIDKVYGERDSAMFLTDSYSNAKNIDMLQKSGEVFRALAPAPSSAED